ncbi:hypothetical protein LLEC1_04562 [Akanthomyces lecanii]|uniref:Uncharacterized protein n=1 Tax=Cordyceps confragosa TaxID=2714763 RepID=A0A179I270_CORDF|nr:hypothetical protein LLEC1_04562 [Akanthomyces lecanii]
MPQGPQERSIDTQVNVTGSIVKYLRNERLFMRKATPRPSIDRKVSSTPSTSMWNWQKLVSYAGPWAAQPDRVKSSDTPILGGTRNEKTIDLTRQRRINERLYYRLRLTERRELAAVRRLKDDKQSHVREIQDLRRKIAKLESDLENESEAAKSLRLQVAKTESQLNKAYSDAVSAWKEDVSRDMPDDIIRSTISSFFKGDFFSWCADMSAPEIRPSNTNKVALREHDVMNRASWYRSEPAYLKFDSSERNESASLVLLEAALSSELCHCFLTTPFFMIRGRHGLKVVEETLAKTSIEAATHWRVNTLKSLGNASSLDSKVAAASARKFVQKFGFLLKDMDNDAVDDLAKLFVQFSDIALKLWATKTNIRLLYGAELWRYTFELDDPFVECDPGIASFLGKQLNGRPIGVIMRPCILSEPIPKAGQELVPVVWSKAMVWVSGEEGPGA